MTSAAERGDRFGFELDDEGFDMLAADRRQGQVPQPGQDVDAQVAAVRRPRRGSRFVCLLPDRHPLPQ